ncbi:MAG: hypothetical protein FWH37_07435 [Candidatus Bathyarchaeota archaeon]|nr:hypothetical protein [Candidatus Termiticorpusculum sp.]
MLENPFDVMSPEEMDAYKAKQLFVEMYSDFPQIRRAGNIIMSGARGCGKSMLIRCSMPDVLLLQNTPTKTSSQLDYLAFYVPVKKTTLSLTELRFLENRHAPYMINEHFMTLHVLMHSLLLLSKITFDSYDALQYKEFFDNTYSRYMHLSGCKDEIKPDFTSSSYFFKSLYNHAEELQQQFYNYIINLNPNSDKNDPKYSLPLLSFLRFIVPVFKKLLDLPGFPTNKNIYLFIDDADNLSKTQTEILNTWISCRTQPTISLKISSQYEMYKTYLTSNGVLIESPHDYQAINISSRYTTNYDGNFREKIIEILDRRLKIVGITSSPEKFFPGYKYQEEKIEEEREKLRAKYLAGEGIGYTESDDVRRYAVPNYIKALGGKSKSRSTFRYAGLDTIIHLSSGIVRYVIDAASNMFDVVCGKNPSINQITEIPTDIQNTVMRKLSDDFLYTELRKPGTEQTCEDAIYPIDSPKNIIGKLHNLICAMGSTFFEILVSERSERKVFSIALTNTPDEEISNVLKMGVRLNYLYETTIGNKKGNGRTWLYILNRRLAPSFILDPSGFQGYLFMTNEDLHHAFENGKRLRTITGEKSDDDIQQLTLDDFWEE